jgi:hypothetical protein
MTRVVGFVLAAAVCAAGCKSDLSQQLLERELRMQEDQIYQLQDELQDKSARLNHVAGENQSLRRQLGFVDGDAAPSRGGAAPSRSGSGRSPMALPTPAEPVLVPPAIDLPGSAPAGGPAPRPPVGPASPAAPATIAPPALDGVPPLPVEPKFSDAVSPPAGGVVPASAVSSAADAPIGQPLSHQESLADSGRITHLVVNPGRTECFDGNGDGVSDGLAVVVEPRDGDERLVTAAGEVVITVFDLSGPTGAPVARFEIPAQEALARFRRTSRNRGLHFVLRWPGSPPPGAHVRVHVALTTFDAQVFETDCTVATRPQPADGGGP